MLRKALVGLAVSAALVAPAAHAGTFTFGLNHLFGDSVVLPGGPYPWATVSITDVDSAAYDIVDVTISLPPGLGADAFVRGVYLNTPVNPLFASPQLIGGQAATSIQYASNDFKAGGDGLFDLLFSFATANNAGQRFTAGESVTYRLFAQNNSGLTAASFNSLSCVKPDCNRAGDAGPFIGAAHFQGLAGGASSWIGYNPNFPPTEVPVPAAAWLLGSGLLAMGAIGRRRISARV